MGMGYSAVVVVAVAAAGAGGGPKIDGNIFFFRMVLRRLVRKTFPDPVGVFCGLPRVPSGHIGQIIFFLGFLD